MIRETILSKLLSHSSSTSSNGAAETEPLLQKWWCSHWFGRQRSEPWQPICTQCEVIREVATSQLLVPFLVRQDGTYNRLAQKIVPSHLMRWQVGHNLNNCTILGKQSSCKNFFLEKYVLKGLIKNSLTLSLIKTLHEKWRMSLLKYLPYSGTFAKFDMKWLVQYRCILVPQTRTYTSTARSHRV